MGAEQTGYDPAGIRRPCIPITVRETALLGRGACMEVSTGEFLEGWIDEPYHEPRGHLIEPVSALGVGWTDAGPLLLQGQALFVDKEWTRSFNGGRLGFKVIEVERSRAVVELRFSSYKLTTEGATSFEWRPYEQSYRLVYAPGTAFPQEVQTGNGSKILWNYLPAASTSGAKPLNPFDQTGRSDPCAACRRTEFRRIPPVGLSVIPWRLEDALGSSKASPNVSEFLGRPSASLVRAIWSVETTGTTIIGPIGTTAPFDRWDLDLIDYQTGDHMNFTIRRDRSGGESRIHGDPVVVKTSFRLPFDFWPARYVDLENAWSALQRRVPGSTLVGMEFNSRLDGEFFSAHPFVHVDGPDSRSGMMPFFFDVRLHVASESRGYEFEFSVVNGQWLFLPKDLPPSWDAQ